MSSAYLFATSAIGLLFAAPAMAQDAAPASAAGVSNLDSIVVTAQKRAEDLQDVPIAVTALSGDSVRQAGLGATEDLPRLTPGLSVNRNASFVGLYLRGVGTQYANPGLESSVAIYVDDTYFPRTGSAIFSFNDIERIEVLKGPQGTLFGRNAAAGVVRIVTNDPEIGEWDGRGSLTYGRFNRISADAVINAPLADNAALRIAAIYDTNDGYVSNLNPGLPNLQDRNVWHLNAKFLWEPTDNLSIKLAGDFGRKLDHEGQAFISLDSSCPTQIAVCLGGTPGGGFRTTTQDLPLENGGDGLEFDHRDRGASLRVDLDTGIGRLSSISTYRYYKFTGAADLDTTDIPFQHALTDGEVTESYSQEFQLVSDSDGPLNYAVGLYYYKEDASGSFNVAGAAINGQLGLPFPAVNAPVNTQPHFDAITALEIEAYAPYAELTYEFTDQLALTVGGRYTHENKTQLFQDLLVVIPQLNSSSSAFGGAFGPREFVGEKFTPKVTLTFRPNSDLMFYGGWSRGFKSGGINTPDFARSPIVEPEVLDSYEIGAKTEFGDFRINGSAFYYDYKNLQVQITDLRCGGSCVQNAATAEVRGLEADITWAPSRAFEIGLGATYLDATFSEFRNGQTFVPAFTTAACATATASPDPADDAACLGYATAARDQSGNRLPQAPEFSGYVRAVYTHELANGGEIRINGLFNHSSSYTYGPDITFGVERSKDLLSGAVTYISPDEFSISVFGDNLLNDKYNTQFARQQTGGWSVPGAPMTWGVRIAKEF